jgi:hypothetical protein
VLRAWDDTKAAEILARCRKATITRGRVLIIEPLIPDNTAEELPVLLSDTNMLGGDQGCQLISRRIRVDLDIGAPVPPCPLA